MRARRITSTGNDFDKFIEYYEALLNDEGLTGWDPPFRWKIWFKDYTNIMHLYCLFDEQNTVHGFIYFEVHSDSKYIFIPYISIDNADFNSINNNRNLLLNKASPALSKHYIVFEVDVTSKRGHHPKSKNAAIRILSFSRMAKHLSNGTHGQFYISEIPFLAPGICCNSNPKQYPLCILPYNVTNSIIMSKNPQDYKITIGAYTEIYKTMLSAYNNGFTLDTQQEGCTRAEYDKIIKESEDFLKEILKKSLTEVNLLPIPPSGSCHRRKIFDNIITWIAWLDLKKG
ncbi:MAG: hypothetical protein HQM01_15350 [Magnetococcales bacterium]|nr:hypothetical protein [Magnetococcales bacterium]